MFSDNYKENSDVIRHKIRNGRDIPNNIYMQEGDEPKGGEGGDPVIGQIGCRHNPELATQIVDAVNRDTERRLGKPPLFDPPLCGADLRTFAAELVAASEWSDAQDMPAPDWDGLLARAARHIEKLSWLIGPDGRAH